MLESCDLQPMYGVALIEETENAANWTVCEVWAACAAAAVAVAAAGGWVWVEAWTVHVLGAVAHAVKVGSGNVGNGKTVMMI